MIDPVEKAKWVLQTKAVGEIPALALKAIADSEDIKFKIKPYAGDWDGILAFNGDKRAILVNTSIDNPARHNFTFAHELGHYFLEHPANYTSNGQSGIHCKISEADIKQKGREREANRFATELLMPEERFRLLMLGAEIDFALFAGLAVEFMVSKQACSYRVMALTQKPCVLVFSRNGKVTYCCESPAARGHLANNAFIPLDTTAHMIISSKIQQEHFTVCEANKWLRRSLPNQIVYECTRGSYGSGTAMTILKW